DQTNGHAALAANCTSADDQQQRESCEQERCFERFHFVSPGNVNSLGAGFAPVKLRPPRGLRVRLLPFFLRLFIFREAHFARFGIRIYKYVFPWQNLTVEDLERQRVLYHSLNGAPQRSSSVSRVVSFAEQEFASRGRKPQRHMLRFEQLGYLRKLQVNDVFELLFAERPENDDVVHAIQKFGAENLAQRFHGFSARTLRISCGKLENC